MLPPKNDLFKSMENKSTKELNNTKSRSDSKKRRSVGEFTQQFHVFVAEFGETSLKLLIHIIILNKRVQANQNYFGSLSFWDNQIRAGKVIKLSPLGEVLPVNGI